LQELVSGLPSFVANTTAELCALVLTDKPTPLRSTLPDAPPGLGAIIEKCLRKSPDERFATIAELALALEPFGPASVKTSVERIVRLTGGQLPPASVPIVPFGQRASDVSSLGQTEMSNSGPVSRTAANVEQDAPTITAQPLGAGTAAAWGSSRKTSSKSRMPLVIAGSALAAIAVLAIVFVAVKKDTPTPTVTNSVAATPPPTTPVASTTTHEPTSVLVATAVAEQTAPSTVAPTMTAMMATKPTATAKPTPTASAKKTNLAPVDTTGFGGRN
jgi:serine/threonine protein kinase